MVSSRISHRKAQTEGVDESVRGWFERVDAKDAHGWLEYLSDDARFCFGAASPWVGKSAIRGMVDASFSTLSAVEQEMAESRAPSDAVICRGEATYPRPDGTALTVPFANLLELDGNGLIRECLIYADTCKP